MKMSFLERTAHNMVINHQLLRARKQLLNTGRYAPNGVRVWRIRPLMTHSCCVAVEVRTHWCVHRTTWELLTSHQTELRWLTTHTVATWQTNTLKTHCGSNIPTVHSPNDIFTTRDTRCHNHKHSVIIRSYSRGHQAVLGVVILSVRLSVTRVDCDKSKWCTAYDA